MLANEFARRENGRVIVRSTPARLQWTLDDLSTADGHSLKLVFSCSARPLDDRNNRAMLEEVFLGRTDYVSAESLSAHFTPALRAAAAPLIRAADANSWVGLNPPDGHAAKDDARRQLIDALSAAASARAFAAGIEFLPPFEIELDSPSYRRQKIEELEQTIQTRRMNGQLEQWEKAALLLKQFRAVRAAAPELSQSAVLEQISPTDRGAILQTLLQAAGREHATRTIWVAAGPAIIQVDRPALGGPSRAEPKTRSIPLPPTLGPLRSVRPSTIDGAESLLIGARSGVFITDINCQNIRTYTDAAIDSQLGFTRALLWSGSLWACHADGGIVRWDLDQPDAPALALRPAQIIEALNSPEDPADGGPRHLMALDDARLIFANGGHLATITPDGIVSRPPAPSRGSSRDASRRRVIALFPQGRQLIAIHEDGVICLYDRESLELLQVQNRGQHLAAAAFLPWLSDTDGLDPAANSRLLLAQADGPIQCIGIEDSLITEYASPFRGPRLLAGAADLVAAVSADRQRLILWNSWNGRAPCADISIAAIARHRIADIHLA